MMNAVRSAQKIWGDLSRRLHRDEKGSVSIETILIIAAVALPILIFILKFGWPQIQQFFNQGMTDLQGGVNNVTNNNNSTGSGS